MRFLTVVIAISLCAGPTRADEDRPQIKALVSQYVSKIQYRSESYVYLIADDILLNVGGCPGIYRHFGVATAAAQCQPFPKSLVAILSSVVLATISPFVYLGAYHAPYLTTAAGVGVSLAGALYYFRREPYFPVFLSERHYRKVREWSEAYRKDLPPVWNETTYLSFHEVMRERILERSARLQAALRDFPAGVTPDEDELRDFYIDYLKLWTLAALYEIETRQYLHSVLNAEGEANLRQLLAELLESVTVCQGLLFQIGRGNPSTESN